MSDIVKQDPMKEALAQAFESIDSQAAIVQAGETGLEWLPGWYTRRAGELADTKARLEAAYHSAKRQIEAEEKALKYRWEMPLRDEIDKQFGDGQAGKRKSIRNLFGKVGYRKMPSRISVTIDDMDKAVIDAEQGCPEAIRRTVSKTELKKAFLAHGLELDGTHVEEINEYQKFYIQPERKLLEGE